MCIGTRDFFRVEPRTLSMTEARHVLSYNIWVFRIAKFRHAVGNGNHSLSSLTEVDVRFRSHINFVPWLRASQVIELEQFNVFHKPIMHVFFVLLKQGNALRREMATLTTVFVCIT